MPASKDLSAQPWPEVKSDMHSANVTLTVSISVQRWIYLILYFQTDLYKSVMVLRIKEQRKLIYKRIKTKRIHGNKKL